MKHIKAFAILPLSSFLLLSSCGGKWDYDQSTMKNAVLLQSTIQDRGETATIGISGTEGFFVDNVNRDSILLAKKLETGSGENGEVTFHDLRDHKIDNFDFSQIDSQNLTITLRDVEESVYYVFFDSDASTSKQVSLATVNLPNTKDLSLPFFSLQQDDYYANVSSPSFVIDFKGASLGDTSKIYFDDAFKGLSAANVNAAEGQFTIETSGDILSQPSGSITLQNGFFSDIAHDVRLYAEVNCDIAYLDQSSFRFEDDFSFLLKSTRGTFVESIGTDMVTLGDSLKELSLKSVGRVDSRTLNVTLATSSGSLGEAIAYLDGGEIILKKAFKEFNVDMPISIEIAYPKVNLRCDYDGDAHTAKISAKINNALVNPIEPDDIEFASSNLCFAGSANNASFAEYKRTSSGFEATLSLNGRFGDHVSGILKIGNGRVKTIWGEDFPVSHSFNSVKKVASNAVSMDSERAFQTKLIGTAASLDETCKGISLSSFLIDLGYNLSFDMNVGAANLDNMIRLFNMIDESYKGEDDFSSLSSHLDVINASQSAMESCLDELGGRLNNAYSGLGYGIHEPSFQTNLSRYDDFRRNYIDKLNELVLNYKKRLQKSAASSLLYDPNPASDVEARVNYITHNKKYIVCVPDPTDKDDKSLEGDILTKYETVAIQNMNLFPYWYTDDNYGGFPPYFGDWMRTGISNNNPNKEKHSDEALFLSYLIPSASASALSDEALEFNELYLSFAKEIARDDGNSILDVFYSLVRDYYNFQNEAEDAYSVFRSYLKELIVLFGSFAQNNALLSKQTLDLDEWSSTLSKANDAIKNNSGLLSIPEGSFYSYALNEPISAELVKLGYALDCGNGKMNNSFFATLVSNGEEATFVQDGRLLDGDALSLIHNRYQMMVETGANVSSSFVSYLVGTNLLNNDTLTEFSNLADSQDNYDYPVLASSLSAKEGLEKGADLTCLDVYGQNGPFEKGKNYGYGQSGDESSWFGGTTSFSVRELETLENESNVSLSYASYYETHPYWPSDQLGIFLNQSEGYVALAFHRV